MNPRITDWSGRRVWLLGASTGIGAALASVLLARGARVALSARNAARLAEVAAAGGGQALVVPCDAADEASLRAAWDALLAAWGGVDVALYVAGDYVPMRAWELDTAKARRMIDVNLVGAVSFAGCVVPQLLRQGNGQIGFVASVAGYRALPKSLIYGPTKAALINFAEALYLDLQPQGIGVRVINPGFVATPLTAQNDFAMPALLTPRAGGTGDDRRFRRRRLRNPLSEALYTRDEAAGASAVPPLLPAVWEMHYRLKGARTTASPQVIRGASHLRFDSAGKVTWHRDYWDAAEELYARLPGIGWLMRLLKRKLAA